MSGYDDLIKEMQTYGVKLLGNDMPAVTQVVCFEGGNPSGMPEMLTNRAEESPEVATPEPLVPTSPGGLG